MSKLAFRIQIQGTVQGVCFRASMKSQADQLKLAGWVQNCSDGSVEAIVEGNPASIETIVYWCHEGPDAAIVDRVDISPRLPEGFSEFSIKP